MRLMRFLCGMTLLTVVAVPALASNDVVASDNLKVLGKAPAAQWIHRATFKDDLLIAAFDNGEPRGHIGGFNIFRLGTGDEPALKPISEFPCPGNGEGTISHWKHFVFQALENPGPPNTHNQSVCGEEQGEIRVVDISDPRNPHKVGFIDLTCGSHGMTVFPDKGRLFIYNSNGCSAQGQLTGSTGQGGIANTVNKIDVIEFDPKHPSRPIHHGKPKIVGMEGCHDITVYPPRDLAVCTGTARWALLDISDPYNPELIGQPIDDLNTGPGSAQFTWDGQYVLLNEIPGRSYPSYFGCFGPHREHAYRIRIWNVEDTEDPRQVGQYVLDREPPLWEPIEDHRCHPSNFTVVPMKDPNRYVAVTSWGSGGMSTIDFSNPGNIKEIAYFQPQDANIMWRTAWYNGRIYLTENWRGESSIPPEPPGVVVGSPAEVVALEVEGLGPHETRYFRTGLVTQWQDPKNLRR